MRILIAAGGSGGHIFPAIALGRMLKAIDESIDTLFVGSARALDRRLYEKEGVKSVYLSANKFPYKIEPKLLMVFLKLLLDIAKSLAIIVRYKPDVVVGFGGYVSFPALFVARVFHIPIVVHEQNVVPGRANRILFGFADKVAISFRDTLSFLGKESSKEVFTGNPVRAQILTDDRTQGLRRFGLDLDKFTLLVVGGSQGSKALNRTFIEAMAAIDPDIKGRLQIIHITGVGDYDWALGRYAQSEIDHRVHSFIDRIEEAYAAADLVVARSGASCLFELALLGKPMILVPYPLAMSHQRENAAVFSESRAALVLEEKSLSAATFKDTVLDLVKDRKKLYSLGSSARRMGNPDAAGNLAKTVLNLVEEKKRR